jgi:transposase
VVERDFYLHGSKADLMGRKIWTGLDVGVETTQICIINDHGEVLQETACATSLAIIDREIRWLRRRRWAKLGMEASSGSHLARGLRSRGYSIDLYETRELSKFLRLRRNKTDQGDALGIAEAGRLGATVVSKVHLKSFECQCLQSKLTIRRNLIRQRVALINLLCRQLELYGGRVSRSTRSMQLRSAVEAEFKKVFGRAAACPIDEFYQLLSYSEQLLSYQTSVDRELRSLAAENDVCRRFLEIPGVGPICALTFYAAVGDPYRFSSSKDVGAYFGLCPTIYQSGLTCRVGRISRMGNVSVRSLLVQASMAFRRHRNADRKLLEWVAGIEQRRGKRKATIALARKLAILMLAIWKSGDHFRSEPRSEALGLVS